MPALQPFGRSNRRAARRGSGARHRHGARPASASRSARAAHAFEERMGPGVPAAPSERLRPASPRRSRGRPGRLGCGLGATERERAGAQPSWRGAAVHVGAAGAGAGGGGGRVPALSAAAPPGGRRNLIPRGRTCRPPEGGGRRGAAQDIWRGRLRSAPQGVATVRRRRRPGAAQAPPGYLHRGSAERRRVGPGMAEGSPSHAAQRLGGPDLGGGAQARARPVGPGAAARRRGTSPRAPRGRPPSHCACERASGRAC